MIGSIKAERPVATMPRDRRQWPPSVLAALVSISALCGCRIPSLALPRDHWYRHYERGQTQDQIIRSYDLQLGDAWNVYFRGCLLAEDGHFERAIEDFEAAISKRPRDKRNMRTYGMHFVDYLPHREKGVCLYHLGRLPEAEVELRRSYRAAPSARAKWYLRELLSKKGKGDLPPPEITVLDPEPPFWVSCREVLLRGEIRASEYIDYLTVDDGRQEWVGTATMVYGFERRLAIQDGANTVTVSARDLAGRDVTKHITIHLDTEPPTVAVLRDLCKIKDEGDVRMVKIDGVVKDVGVPGDDGWHVFPVPGARTSVVHARDTAGNAVTHTCRLEKEPTICLPFGDKCKETIVQNEVFAIGGRAYSKEGIDRVNIEVSSQGSGGSLNRETISPPSPDTQEMYFSQLLRLRPDGSNLIKLWIVSKGIPSAPEARLVTVAPSNVLALSDRLRVLVFPPVVRPAREELGGNIQKEIELELGSRFRVIRCDEVAAELLRQILQHRRLDLIEQLYVRKDIARSGPASEVAEGLMFVVIIKYGAGKLEDTLEVRVHLMEAGSGIRLLDGEAYGTQQDLKGLVKYLCATICQEYPALKAPVTHVGPGKRVRVEVGWNHGLHPGMTCLLYRATQVDTGAEELKTYRKIPARGRITRSEEAESQAKYITQDGGVSVGDVLATR